MSNEPIALFYGNAMPLTKKSLSNLPLSIISMMAGYVTAVNGLKTMIERTTSNYGGCEMATKNRKPMTPEEIRKKYQLPVKDDLNIKRSCYHCSKCDTYFLYYPEKLPQSCQLCGGMLRQTIFPYEITKSFKHSNKDPLTLCCECCAPTERAILGKYICEKCYPSEYKDIPYEQYDLLNFDILSCGIEYHPEKIICKDCSYYRDCSTHYVLIEPQKKIMEVPLDLF